MHSWSIVVPAKRFGVAKTRLRPLTAALGGGAPDTHEELVLALLADTVTAALSCPAVGAVLVVTDEPAAADLARALGARTAADMPDRGLNAALEHGAALAGGSAVAALSSDLPALRPQELSAALETAAALHQAAAAARCFVPDAQGTGTTLLTAVGTALAPRFGPGSARAHRDSGAMALTGDWPGLLQDVDTEDDLRAALALGAGPRTRGFAGRFAAQLRTAR